MSRIDELIAELCPNGVETKRLGDISHLVRGHGLPKTDFSEDGVGAIHYGQIYTQYGIWADETSSFVPPQKAEKLAKVDPGDIIITNTSENLEDVCKAVAWVGDDTIVTGGHATVIKHEQNAKYLSYWFASSSFQKCKRALATGVKVIDISAKKLENVKIPVPPLEVQREIVRILDKFTQLEAELEAELEARRKQYVFCRDRFLEEVCRGNREVSLGDIARISTGEAISKKVIADHPGPYPVINSGKEPLGFIDTYNVEADPLGVTSRGAGVGSITWREGQYYRGNLNYSVTVRNKSEFLDRFFYYYLTSRNSEIQKLCTYQGIPALNKKNLESLKIAMVPLREQQKYVEVLDKFDALVNDLNSGLPAEIKARRKQYEYYRDKLLTFPPSKRGHTLPHFRVFALQRRTL